MSASTASPRTAEPSDLAALAGQKLGNYRLEQLVGRGRMGVVYRANDEALLRPTAVKVLSWAAAEAAGQDPVQWFLSEARLVARINHPRVVQIYGVARHADLCYIAMEYVAGDSAEALVARGGPMSPEAATEILLQAATALQAAHASGVVHRDVKPGNLLVGPDQVTKLGDFGIAMGPPDVDPNGSRRLRVGTPHYTAPEIWRGEAASPASDLYALGATFFHLLTGRPPFAGADALAVEQAHLRAAVPDPRSLRRDVPASCAALAMHALAKAPRDRPASAQELVWAARTVLQELRATVAPRAERASPPAARRADPAGPAPGAPLADVLGFTRRPFFDADPASPPYAGPPFDGARQTLLERLLAERAPAIAVTGPHGAGKTVLARGVAAELASSRLVLALDLAAPGEAGSLLELLCRAAGVVEAAQLSLEALVDQLGEELRQRKNPPLLLLDGASHGAPPAAELSALLAAARGSGAFQLLLVGGHGLGVELGLGDGVPEIALPPLATEDVGAYVDAWVRATRPADAPPIFVSPDARLLMAHRSEGLPGRLDVLAENMLLLAAAGRLRTLSSWHACAACDRERWTGRPPSALPRRPPGWPPSDVVALIDSCRRGAGLPPWPKGAP
ncbi:MAG: protein kinase domain-containing protein [Anaeromyxobacteraceae bacterium]